MLVSYENFKTGFVSMIKIRSKNYVNTDCDIDAILSTVYADVSTQIIFEWVKQSYTVVDEYSVVLPTNNIVGGDASTITEEYGEVMDIVDDEDMSINKILAKVDTCTYKWLYEEYRDSHIGDAIYFVRPVVYRLEHLPSDMYDKLFTALLEGVMYHIQLSIPSQGDTQAGNLAYQRYFSEKQKLLNLHPQIQYVDKNMPIREYNYEYSV